MLLVGLFLIGVAKAQKNQKLAGAWFLCEFVAKKSALAPISRGENASKVVKVLRWR